MNIQVTVTRAGQISNQASFPSMEEAQAWVDLHVGMGSFGAPRFSLQLVEVSPAVVESQEVLDAEGVSFDPPQFQDVEISPVVFEEQSVETNPEGYVISIEDLTAQLAQEAINAASLKYLAETDWMIIRESECGVACPQEVKDLRAVARLSIVR